MSNGFDIAAEVAQGIREAGADSYLAKPVSIGPFMAAVRGLVDRQAA